VDTSQTLTRTGRRGGWLESSRRKVRSGAVALVAAVALSSCAIGGSAADSLPKLTAAQKQQMTELGLDTERPYAGTELNFLICCHDAPQFGELIKQTKQFTKLTGISVTWADVPYESYQDRVTAEAVTGGGNYDLVAWVDAWGPSIKAALLPLDDRLQEAGISLDDYPPVYRDVMTAGDEQGRTLGLPLRGHPFLSFYRKDVLQQHNLEVPTTWDEHRAMSETIAKEGGIAPTAQYYGVNGAQNLFTWVSMLWSKGGSFFNDQWEPTFNSAEGVAAAEDYAAYLSRGLTPKGAVSWGESEALTEFVQGRVAGFNGWWWMYGNMLDPEVAKQDVRENVTFAPAPVYDENQTSVTYAYLWPVGILQQSENQDAAWEYLKWLTHPETELDVVKKSDDPGGLVHLDTMANEQINKQFNGLPRVGAKVLEHGRALPLIPEWPQISSILEVAINDIAGGADAQQRLDDAAREVRELLQQHGYFDN